MFFFCQWGTNSYLVYGPRKHHVFAKFSFRKLYTENIQPDFECVVEKKDRSINMIKDYDKSESRVILLKNPYKVG